MVNFWGPVDEPILNDIKSNNEEIKSKKEDNIKEKTTTYNEINFVQFQKDNIWIEHSKLKKLEENKKLSKPKRGRVIFMQHGLDGLMLGGEQHIEFQVMVAYLTRKGLTGSNGYGYVSLGIVTKRKQTIKDLEGKNIPKIKKGETVLFLNNNKYDGKSYYDNIHTNSDGSKTTYGLQQFINELTLSNNVLIRNEFSSGILSFSEQLQQYTEIVELFGNFEADVTFIGHSMGGLASINYSVDYHNNTKKNVDVITISTPYDNNTLAMISISPAHRELAGFDKMFKGEARENLESKWNEYDGNIDLISIGVDVNKYINNSDNIVSLKSQLNLRDEKEIYKNSIKILIEAFGTQTIYKLKENKKTKEFELLEDTTIIENHLNTPDLKDVIEVTNKMIIK